MSGRPLVVALVGAECSGKTTLATRLAVDFHGRVVPECLRQFVIEMGRTPEASEQRMIMRRQIELEDVARRAAQATGERIVVADPAALMTAVYSVAYFDDDSLIAEAVEHQDAYDITLWCDTDLQWVADGDQRDGPAYRDKVHGIISDVTSANGVDVHLVSGPVDQRIGRLAELLPWT